MKKTYSAPKLRVHGSIEELTQSNVKTFGASDGWVLAPDNTPIGDVKMGS